MYRIAVGDEMNQPAPPQEQAGKWRPAEVEIEAWRRRIRAGTFSNRHYEMGRAPEREGNLPAAAACTSVPGDPHAATNHAICPAAAGQTAEASQLLDGAMASAPGTARPRYAAALLSVRNGDEEQARRLLSEGERLKPQQTTRFIRLLPGGAGKLSHLIAERGACVDT